MRPDSVYFSTEVLAAVGFNNSEFNLTTKFSYCSDDPYAIHALFSEEGNKETVRWVWSREVLDYGLLHYVPFDMSGAMRAYTEHRFGIRVLTLFLSDPEKQIFLHFPYDDFFKFMSITKDLIPFGEEYLYLDFDKWAKELKI